MQQPIDKHEAALLVRSILSEAKDRGAEWHGPLIWIPGLCAVHRLWISETTEDVAFVGVAELKSTTLGPIVWIVVSGAASTREWNSEAIIEIRMAMSEADALTKLDSYERDLLGVNH